MLGCGGKEVRGDVWESVLGCGGKCVGVWKSVWRGVGERPVYGMSVEGMLECGEVC